MPTFPKRTTNHHTANTMRCFMLSLLFVATMVAATAAQAKNECVANPVGKFAYDSAFRTYREIATKAYRSNSRACGNVPAIEDAVLARLNKCKATSPNRKIKETCCTKGQCRVLRSFALACRS